MGPEEGHEVDQRAGTTLFEDRLRVRIVESGEEKASEKPDCSLSVP